MKEEQRKFIRSDILNLLDYLVVDEHGQQGEYSMGRTLNISQEGILLETMTSIPIGMQVMITMGLDNELIEIMGTVMHTIYKSKRHQNGIEFFHIADDDKVILTKHINIFRRNLQLRHNLSTA